MQKSQRLERVKVKGSTGAATSSAASTPKKGGKKGAKAAIVVESEEEEEEYDEDEAMTPDEVAAAAAAASGPSEKSWVDSTVEASDLLPTLVNMCEKRVYALALAPSAAVRNEALQLMGVILHQAVSNPIDAMATLIAALTDRESVPSQEAVQIITGIVSKKKGESMHERHRGEHKRTGACEARWLTVLDSLGSLLFGVQLGSVSWSSASWTVFV